MNGGHEADVAHEHAERTLAGGRERYTILRMLGQGGFGVTHLARRERDGREVVVKQLRLDRMDDWKAFDLFEREAKVLEALDHANIPAFIDHFEVKDERALRGFALVQEYVPGRTLRDAQQERPTPRASAMRPWLERLLEVCAYLHAREPPVIHRDISPKNVIVRDDGEPVLIDFGTVQHALRSADTISSTSAGTFGYAAPEQLLGRAMPASDLYGLAMTYLAVASGREPEELPFAGNRVRVSAALAEHDTHPRLGLLLEELTDPDATRRPQSAAEVLGRVRAIPIAGAAGRAVVVAAAPAASVEEEVRGAWEARARRAAQLGRAGALRPPPVPKTDRLRKCTIDAGGAFALVEHGSKDRVVQIDLRDWSVERWDTRGFPEVYHPDATFDLEGRSALVVSFSRGGLLTRSPSGPPQRRSLSGLPDGVAMRDDAPGSFTLSPDGRLLALVEEKINSVALVFIELESSTEVQRIPLEDRVTRYCGVRFVPDGSAVLIESIYGHTWIVDAKGSTEKLGDTRIAIAEDGRTVARGDAHELVIGTVERWTPLELRDVRRVCTLAGEPRRMVLSPDARWLAFQRDGRVTVIDVPTGSVRMVAEDPYRPGAAFESVDELGFSADGRRLFMVGDGTLHPLATERADVLAVYSLTRAEPIGTVRWIEDRDELYGCTVFGIHGRLSGAAELRALLLDEAPASVLGDACDAALDYRDRVAFWGAEVGAGRLTPNTDLAPIVAASEGLAHVLPVAVKRATEAIAGAPARFGAVAAGGSTPGLRALVDALGWLAEKGEAEREVLYHDMLDELVAREVARAAAAAATATATATATGDRRDTWLGAIAERILGRPATAAETIVMVVAVAILAAILVLFR